MEFTAENGIDLNSEYEHRSISSLKSLHKRVSSKLSFKAIKVALEKIKLYVSNCLYWGLITLYWKDR